MFLKQFIYVNWGNIPNGEFEFGPINLFSGGNGSGKTTAADALQTVMTAAHENLFQYNPGQNETTQRGSGGKRVRTLASYVLGCDDGSYARTDTSDGYLAAVFHPTQGETAPPFTAIIGVRAWLEASGNQTVARHDEAVFFILPGEQLTLGHFQREDKGGRYVVPLEQIQGHLITEFGKRSVERYDTKKAYMRRLYGALRGRVDSVTEREAVAAARAFSRFMAYKPVSSINQFVAEEILERKDLGEAIRTVSSQLKTIHAMEREVKSLLDSIALLGTAADHAQGYIGHWIELNTLDYTRARYDYVVRQRDYLAAKKRQEELRNRGSELEDEIRLAAQRHDQIHDQLVSLEAQRQGIDALRQKDQLDRQRQDQEQRLVTLGRDLLIQDNRLQQNNGQVKLIAEGLQAASLAAELAEAGGLESRALVRDVLEKGRRGDIDLHRLLQQDLTGDLGALEHYLDQARTAQRLHNQLYGHWRERRDAQPSLRDRLATLHSERSRRYEQCNSLQRQKQVEIERLEARQVNYPAHVERALTVIRAQLPKADPRVLCDHIEVTDPRWQSAIEGYLGGARYGIIVHPDYEAEAIRLVRAMPGRDNKARVIQGHKASEDAARMSLEGHSIVHVLGFSHAVARDYLIASYGSVVRVDSAEALRHTRRGVTADGMASGNYTLFRCDLPDAELVFGAAARERALAAKRAELEQLTGEWQQSNDRMQESARLLDAVDRIEPLSHADTVTEMIEVRRELARLEELLANLDLGEHRNIEARLAQLKEESRHWREQHEQLTRESGAVANRLSDADRSVQELAASQDTLASRAEACEEELRKLQTQWPLFDAEAALDTADTAAREGDPKQFQRQHDEIIAALHKSERDLEQTVLRHNGHCRPGDAVFYTGFESGYDTALFQRICGVRQEIDRVFNVLSNNILVDKHAQLAQIKASFNNAFVTHLCQQIHQAIKEGERQIESLNRELQHHRFGADRETFRFASEWLPEFRDYARFFEEVTKNPTLGEETTLFDVPLGNRSVKVRDELMALLLDEDEHKALRQLERIADYRNYRRYEIFKEVEGKSPIPLSEYGTGSGGQLETPAYIIRSAAITSAFRFAEGQNHLRMVLVDEAFMHMDEMRSREVINYLTQALGLQLIFIMPTSKCGPFMDLISNEFIFAKVPSTPRGQLRTRVLVDRKVCNRERIAELWEHHRRTVYQQAELDFMSEL